MEPITNFTDNNYPNIQIKYSVDDMMNIWSVLLSKMQEDYYKSGGTGLFPKLASFADFNDDTDEEKGSFSYFLEDLIQNYKDNDWNSNPAEHWNDSWAAALKSFITGIYYLNHQDEIDYEDSAEIYINKDGDIINSNDIRGGISSSGASFRYKDMLKADAGANFVKTLYEQVENNDGIYVLKFPWVIPWYNINGDSYSTVRGIDKCIAALSSSDNLDFTTADFSGDKNIRLIMPRNTRKVEVEDLNRNFWVIAQVISAMSIYLFDENGPIPKSFKDLIGALTDIWENVEYLWTSIAAIGQTPYITKVKTLVFPLTVDEIMPYNKFDNFENFADSSIFDGIHDGDVRTLCEQRLGYLKDSYEDCHLAILPEIRLNNYEKNYYSKVFYPGIMTLNRNNINGWSWLDFIDDNGDYLNHHLLIDSISFSDLYVIKESEERYYDYFVPAGAPPTEDISRRFYKLLRPEYDINCYYDEENNVIAWDLEHKTINYYDLARYIIEDELACVWTNGVWSAQILEGGAGEIDITQGFYQGELLSAPVNSNALQWDIGGTVYELQAYGESFSEITANEQSIKEDSINVLNKILEIRTGTGDDSIDLPKINDNAFHLFIGNHLYEADPQSSASENHHEHNYYKVVNNNVKRDTDYVRVANGISCGGVLWNPIGNQIESYPDYWTYTNYQAYGPYLLSSLKIEIYLKKNSLRVEEDNWLIKVSEVIGSTVGEAQLPEEYVYDYDYADVNKAINERIFVSYFMPNSKFAMKKKERTPLATDNPGVFPANWTITGSIPNMDDYKLLNTTRRSGVWQRRNKSTYANYELYPNKGF